MGRVVEVYRDTRLRTPDVVSVAPGPHTDYDGRLKGTVTRFLHMTYVKRQHAQPDSYNTVFSKEHFLPTAFIVTLPADADDLRDEIEERLGAEGDVYPAPPTYGVDPEQIKLIVEIALGGATLIKTLLEIKQMYAAQGKPTNSEIEKLDKGSVALDETDEQMLQHTHCRVCVSGGLNYV